MSTNYPLQTVSFKNTQLAFIDKSDKELKRSGWLFKLINKPSIVKVFSKLTVWSIRAGLPVEGMIKSTIFRQFCGGETIE